MDINNLNGFSLFGVGRVNVVLGKNGCGKSFLLKKIEQALSAREGVGVVRYVSPERGGQLMYNPAVAQNIDSDPTWMPNERRKNQSANFRQQSAALFRRLEFLVLREIERDHTKEDYEPRNFDTKVDQLNTLLDRIKLERDDQKVFSIHDQVSGNPTPPEEISSGEAELISLGIEFLAFIKEAKTDMDNYLLVDEPDVHLHPDLQDRLAKFIVEIMEGAPVTLVIATHSTAILAGLSGKTETRVAFMQRDDQEIRFKSVTDVDRAILPIFGAHPLSNVFNQAPILLIEGEDDERVWQQVVRTSQGRIRLFPCVVHGNGQFTEYENEVSNIIGAVYDNARAYSLRDRDLDPELIDDAPPIIRMRLGCREAENLMLCDEVLNLAETDWSALQKMLRTWATSNTGHQYWGEVQAFIEGGFDRKGHDLKSIRNILIGLVSSKPWEVLVGQAIAGLPVDGAPDGAGSLRDCLGGKVCQTLLNLN